MANIKLDEIQIGTPANILYVHDSRAAVVTHRTPRRVTIARVEVGPSYHESPVTGDTPPIVLADGILDKVIPDTERTYTLKQTDEGRVYGDSKQYGRCSFGISRDRTNYQNF